MAIAIGSASTEAVCRHGSMLILRDDNVIGRSLTKYGEWAEVEIQFLSRFVTPSSTVLDVGAYIGTHTLPFARSAACVYAFEPQPIVFNLLRSNVEKNGLTNVKLMNTGVSEFAGDMVMCGPDYSRPGNFGQMSLASRRGDEEHGRPVVPVVSIDELNLSSCDLIKIDVEGMEPSVLKGASKTIGRCRPVVYAECLSVEAGWKCVTLLKAHDYLTFLKLTQAYNPRNFGGDREDVFNGAKEAAIVGIPVDREATARDLEEESEDFFRVTSLDDLSYRLVETTKLQQMSWVVREQKERVEQLSREAVDRMADVERLSSEAAGHAGHIEHLARELVEQRGEADMLRSEVVARTATTERLTGELIERTADVERLTSEAAGRAGQIEHLARELAEQRGETEMLRSEVVARTATTERLTGVLIERTADVERLASEAAGRASHIEHLARELAERNAEAEVLRGDVLARTATAERLTGELNQRKEEVERLEAAATERAKETRRLARKLSERTEETGRLREQAAEGRRESDRLAWELGQRSEEIKRLTADSARSIQLIEQTQQMCGGLTRLVTAVDEIAVELRETRKAGDERSRSTAWRVLADRGRALGRRVRGRRGRLARLAGRLFALRHRLSRSARIIGRSGLFDSSFYLEQNPDVAASGVNPLVHYLSSGAREGRAPHPLFDGAFYLERNPDVAAAGENGLLHFLAFGAREARDPHVLFDTSFYLERNPDVVEAGVNPLVHFLTCGAREGRNPHSLFDSSFYLERNPDVTGNPLVHYLAWGAREGRDPFPLFDTSFYLEQNKDVAATGENPLAHYLTRGGKEARAPHMLFDGAFYLDRTPDVKAAGVNPLLHYLAGGAEEGYDPHLLFDSSFYLEQNPDVVATGVNPLLHYVASGATDGRDPHPLFDTSLYLEQNPDVAGTGDNPLVHYLASGGREGRAPHALFDGAFYLERNPDVAATGVNPLVHYLAWGGREGRAPHLLFDGAFYLKRNPDVAAAADNPLVHYLSWGGREGRAPHPLFDGAFYLARNPEVAATTDNPLAHYLSRGGREGRDPHPLFDSAFYLQRNPEVAAADVNPLVHYLSRGVLEGRDPHPLFWAAWYGEELKKRHGRHPPEPSIVETREPHVGRLSKPGAGGEVTYAFTSICLNYVPKARVLATTLKKHNPNIRFCLLINEPVPEWAVRELEAFDEVVGISDLDIPDKTGWIFKHTLVELSTAAKAFYMRELLERPNCGAVFYFDPDIAVWSSLEPLVAEFEHASILLTPHQTVPDTTVDAIMDNEICSLKHGVFNLGFLGLKPSPEGLRFADWWRDRVEKFCIADIPNGLFTDQRWVDLAPAFFKEIAIIRHPGCNVATWNLTHRHVAGDLEAGFTVNEKPLVFYHFSGFDSGAQEVMLQKYGGTMPAAHALRKWYIAETERRQDNRLRRSSWAYGFFTNGEVITDDQRKLYRNRVDLQEAFADPFDTSSEVNYHAWFRAEMVDRSAEEKSSADSSADSSVSCEMSPLIHFLDTWPTLGLRPNPYFDPLFYSAANSDVAATGVDPLSHYLHIGAREGRDPASNFDTAFYLTQVPGGTTPANPLAHYIESGQGLGLRINPLFDSEKDQGKLDSIKRWSRHEGPLILLISHYGGGGTEKHVRELATLFARRARFLLMTPTSRKSVWLQTLDPFLDVRLAFDPVGQQKDLVSVIRELGVTRIHIHHLLGNEHYLADLVAALRLPFDFTAHDYYELAPNPFLVGDDGRFVGEDLLAQEDALLRSAINGHRPRSLAAWQAAVGWLLHDAHRVIAPSHDLATRLTRQFKDVSPIVAAHPEPHRRPFPVRARSLQECDRLKIAILGDLFPHKGLGLVCQCAALNSERGGRLFFQLIGEPTSRRDDLIRDGVSVIGPYRDEDLLKLIEQCAPDVIWYPVRCPEAYSYTLSAGLASGLPIVVSNIGAFPERIAAREWTWIQPWDAEPEEAAGFFERIRVQNFVTGSAPIPAAGSKAPSSDFYTHEYLFPAVSQPTSSHSELRLTGSHSEIQ